MSSRSALPFHVGAFALLGAAALLSGCDEGGLSANSRASAPIAPETLALMKEKGTTKEASVLIRAYKKESELEIWKMQSEGRYALLKTYPICRWSGQLGPKAREGDRQVPEGFYSITPAQMKPDSSYYLAFNVGYPNAYDRAMGHDGGSIMVHGICASAGCFSMTDPQIGEIYAIVREGFSGGQREVQMQSYPFRMSAENMAKYRLDPNIGFWKQLKEGSDNFEVTKQEVSVGVCARHYVFNAAPVNGHFDAAGPCPPLKQDEKIRDLVASKQSRDEAKVARLISEGAHPIHTVYVDGGGHPSFASIFAYASRPEALARGPIDVALDEARPARARISPVVQMAAAKTAPSEDKAVSPAAGVKVGNAADVTGSVAPAKEREKPSLFAQVFGDKPKDSAAKPAAASGEAAASSSGPASAQH
jgi:murein L,D-transpeptidase YafK